MANIYTYGKDKTIDLHDKAIPLNRRVAFGLVYIGRITESDFNQSHEEVGLAVEFIKSNGFGCAKGESIFDEFANRKGEVLKRKFQVKKQCLH